MRPIITLVASLAFTSVIHANPDVLLDPSPFVARAHRTDRELTLQNGLVARTWRLDPNGACVAYDDLVTGRTMLRSVRPEARLTIDGTDLQVGGLVGQPNHAFLTPAWLDDMTASPDAMTLLDVEIGAPETRFEWKRRRHASPDVTWPPKGVAVRMDYAMPDDSALDDVRISVHYEMYDGLPAMSKWITVHNDGDRTITIDRVTTEELALVEHANWVEHREGVALPRPEYLHVETDFAFGGFNHENANRHVVHWRTDPLYSSQVNWAKQTPCLLVCEPTRGPAQDLEPGDTFETYRTFELVFDSTDRERRGLLLRRMYRVLAPWVTENPITHHLLANDPARVRRAIDDAAAVGFEAVILSFGSGFDMERSDDAHLDAWTDVADHAEAMGVELGSYSLFSSRNVGEEHMIVSPEGERPTHGQCPAATSEWGLRWLDTIRAFYDRTGFDQFENDGPYPGDVDVTGRPPHQKGELDSRWAQWSLVAGLYRDLRARGVYINAPDFYFLNGSNKCGMGYREVNWSLPRAHQVIHTRQNIHDGTWTRTPSMGWMFVPLSQYHGGGDAATIEPLHEHLDHYRRMMLSNLGMGVQAHYRGPRLFDTDETKRMVRATIDWFKAYRDILESDIVHGRRADGRDLDWALHVNPAIRDRGMLCVYNPLDHEVTRTIRVNLYYTGLSHIAIVSERDERPAPVELERDFTIEIECTVPAGDMNWWIIRDVSALSSPGRTP